MARLSQLAGKKTRQAHNAQQRVQDALTRGEIKKPSTCSNCGAKGAVEFSHQNYGGRLNGKWLCPRCHHAQDAKSPKGGGSGKRGTERA